jgi:hypothetical protein
MRFRIAFTAAAAASVAACGQQEQHLPFSSASTSPVEKTITSSGGTVSTPAGAAIVFPSGALNGSTDITVAPTATSVTAEGIGSPVAQNAITIGPAGTRLSTPAAFETKVAPTLAQDPNAWLSVVLLETPAGVRVFSDVDIDLNNGILRTDIDQLGTLTPIIPAAAAHFRLKSSTLMTTASRTVLLDVGAGSVAGIKTLGMTCGALPEGVPVGKIVYCTGMDGFASDNVLARYGDIETVWPTIEGQFTIATDPTLASGAAASGEMISQTTFRAQGGDGATAVSLPFKVTVTATAGTRATQVGNQLTLSNVQIVKEWPGTVETSVESLVMTVNGNTASFNQSRDIDLGDGNWGTVWVRFTFDTISF